MSDPAGALLSGLAVVQLGPGMAAAVCGRLLADLGAAVTCVDRDECIPLGEYLDGGKRQLAGGSDQARAAVAAADLIICEGRPARLLADGRDAESLQRTNGAAAIVLIAPFGQTGPDAERATSDLTLFFASGIARLLTGQVDDLSEPPLRPAGEQSAFIGGLAAACAGMHAVLRAPAVVDVSIQEVLASLSMTDLVRAGLSGAGSSRKREADGNGATVCILPARDGYVAISPREDHQWATWLGVMGLPDWGAEPRFATRPDRIENWDALHALMSAWSRAHDKRAIAAAAQAAHVPSFPLLDPAEHLASPQLAHRAFFRRVAVGGRNAQAPGSPFGLALRPGVRRAAARGDGPLAGVRVLDFSWVIAGPTATRILAAMGAEVIKVEAPGGEPGRRSPLHTALGQAKRGVVLDLKQPAGVEIARRLAARSDVLIENFASGVMDRLGLGADALREVNPGLVYISASGLGRTGPESRAVAYGTLLQCYAGFAGLNRHPDRAPRVGMAWLDPMCGLMLACVAAAALWRRGRDGAVARVDFSMIEAMLWTMAEPLLAAQSSDAPTGPQGNRSGRYAPHGAYRCAGGDAWVAIAVTSQAEWRALCGVVPALAAMADAGVAERREREAAIEHALAAWAAGRAAQAAAMALQQAGVGAAALADARTLTEDGHLRARGFWDEQDGGGALPGLPWRASFPRRTRPAPALGADTEPVLRDVLGLPVAEIAGLRAAGVFG